MKKFKKLIPAFCMLLISAVLMGTSTYAWFSMNTKVTASGMQVNAKSDDTYLLISSEKTVASEIQTENKIEAKVTIAEEASKVYACAPVRSDAEVGYTATTGKDIDGDSITTAGKQVTDPATAAAVTNWYTARSVDPTKSDIDANTARQLKAFTGYVITQKFYLTVAKGATAATNLSVTATFVAKETSKNIDALTAIVTTSDGGFATIDSAKRGTKTSIIGANTDITDNTVVVVTVYLFVDGTHSTVYTNNVSNLSGATVNFAFEVDSKK